MKQLPDFSKAKVLVVGDVLLDRYWSGDTCRISPEAPVPVVRVKHEDMRPGGAANVALNVSAMGATSQLFGWVGEDEAGQQLADRLLQGGVQPQLQRSQQPTIVKLRVLSRHQQLMRLDFEETSVSRETDPLLQSFSGFLQGADSCLLSDYGKGALQSPRPFIRAANKQGIPVIVDPKGRDFSIYQGATLITPNLQEFQAVVGSFTLLDQLVERGQNLLEKLKLQALLVTRGDQGMTLLQRDAEPFHLPTTAREVFDVTGAGDTVVAIFGVALAAGLSFTEAAKMSNAAAGIVVGKLGTAVVTPDELHHALAAQLPIHTTVCVDEAAALVRRQGLKAQGQTLVMTNGCFDILHPGHISYLEAAKAMGDHLLVAVNDDASVQALKGTGRPINPLKDRMSMLAGLSCVDSVVSFSEPTPARLINCLKPDILVKGGDYTVEQIAGSQSVLAEGGEVRILHFVEGYSSTKVIQRIKNLASEECS